MDLDAPRSAGHSISMKGPLRRLLGEHAGAFRGLLDQQAACAVRAYGPVQNMLVE